MTLDKSAVLVKLKVWLVQHKFNGIEIKSMFSTTVSDPITNNFKFKIQLFDIISPNCCIF